MIEFDIALNRGHFSLQANLRLDAPVVGLFGPSGSGKSTLLGVLAGSIKPDHGQIVLNGRILLDSTKGINIPVHRRRIGMVFQDSRLFPHLKVKGNLRYGFSLSHSRDRRFGFDQIVDLLEIAPLLEKRPHQLSGGERQRVALGRTLLASPDMLLLDEPMASLDQRLKAQILPFLRRIKEEVRVPTIYVSHDINEILHLTQQVVMIQNGHILAHGDFHAVITADSVLNLARSLGFDNVITAKVTEHHPELGYSLAENGPHVLTLPLSEQAVGSTLYLSIPASNISLSKYPVHGVTIQNQAQGTVISIQHIDHRALVSVDAGDILIAEVTAKAVHDLGMAIGDKVYCLIKAQAIRNMG